MLKTLHVTACIVSRQLVLRVHPADRSGPYIRAATETGWLLKDKLFSHGRGAVVLVFERWLQ